MKIIAFSGKKQSGKTTAVCSLYDKIEIPQAQAYIENKTPSKIICRIISFAGELKRIINTCFSDRAKYFEADCEKEAILPCGKSAREVLQLIGTDWFRSLDENCWVRAYKKECKSADSAAHPRPVLIFTPDVRFPNEVKCIQDLGGHVIRLLRCPFPDDKHESEIALDEIESWSIHDPDGAASGGVLYFDAIIDNREMSIEEQNEAVWKLVNERKWI